MPPGTTGLGGVARCGESCGAGIGEGVGVGRAVTGGGFWNDGVSTLPEGAPTPRSNSPVPGIDAQSPDAPPLLAEGEGAPQAPEGFAEPEGDLVESTKPEQPQPAGAGAEGQAYAEAEGEALEAAYGGGEGVAKEGEESDPDEAHFQETFERFLELRRETGEAGNVSYEKFVAKLRRNRGELMERHHAKGVRFSVYLKDGRAAIKASALR